MSDVIFKYTIRINDTTDVKMPLGAEILSVQHQNPNDFRSLVCWARHARDLDTGNLAPHGTRRFLIVGTGFPFEDIDGQYLASVQVDAPNLVFHVFDQGYV